MCLDEHRGFDGALGNFQHFLRSHKDVVPQPGLQIMLQLGQIQVYARIVHHPVAGVVEEIHREIEEAGRAGSPSTRMCFSRKCQPRGRTSRVATFWFSL